MTKLTEADQESQRQQQELEFRAAMARSLIKTIYVDKNDALECRCVYGCEVKFSVVPYVSTPKAFGECEHFRYVMLLEDGPSQAAKEEARR
jgi:hypothetical protein